MSQLYATAAGESNPRIQHHIIQLNRLHEESSLLGPYAMNGGSGVFSYAQNSSYQRGFVDAAKPLLEQEIAAKLETTQAKSFRIADFGCSTGRNSFPAIQIITQAIEEKLQAQGLTKEFHVFFNDQLMNDFNTLFHSLPPQTNFYAAAVPGSFHGRLFPKASLDFAYSSSALNWLSEVPKAVADRASPAWNKGKVHYTGAKQEVFEAYSNHYAHNIQSFLEARAEELVSGGLMALLVPAVPDFINSPTSFTTPTEIDLLGSCLIDMEKKGIISEEEVDAFNFPLYYTIPQELKAIIERSSCFEIERMEILDNPGKLSLSSSKARAAFLRAPLEGMLTNHFGSEFMDEIFERYTNKLAASQHIVDPHNDKSIIIFVVLKRKAD